MYNQVPNYHNQRQSQYQQLSLIDPYVVETLKSVKGARLVVETTRGSLQGNLVDVKPDHIVLKDRPDDQPFYIRIQQIVHIMPIND